MSSPGSEGFQGSLLKQFVMYIVFFVFFVFLLKQVWISDLEVHQQVAAGAVDVTAVTLKQKTKLFIFLKLFAM